MNSTNDKLTQPPAPEQPQPPKGKRFRIVRLEERIAPRSPNAHVHEFTHKCRPSW